MNQKMREYYSRLSERYAMQIGQFRDKVNDAMQIGRFRDKVNDAMRLGKIISNAKALLIIYRSIADGRYYSIVGY